MSGLPRLDLAIGYDTAAAILCEDKKERSPPELHKNLATRGLWTSNSVFTDCLVSKVLIAILESNLNVVDLEACFVFINKHDVAAGSVIDSRDGRKFDCFIIKYDTPIQLRYIRFWFCLVSCG